MAEVTGLRSNALNYPAYAAPYGVTFPILDADGDLVTGAAGLDSEISKNGDTFADCTNEATEIATSSGMYYLLLTATELTTDVATIIVKTSTVGAKTTPMVLYPRKLVTLRSGTAQGGAAGSITLDSGASGLDNAYAGCLIVGTLDSTVEARICTGYTGSSKVATVTPDWVTTPDSDDTFIVYLPEGQQVPQADVRGWLGTVPSTPTVAGVPNVNTKTWNDLTTVELPLVPTTAGRKLDVTTGGEAGIDWNNIGAPTTTQALTGTTISTTQVVASVTGAVGSVTGAVGSVTGNVGGNVTGSVGSVVGAVGSVTGAVGSVTGNVGGNVNGNVVGSVASVTARVTANTDQLAGQTVTAAAGVNFPTSVASPTNLTAGTITTVSGNVNGNVGGNVTGSVGSVVGAVGSVTGAVGSVTGNVGGNVTGSVGSVVGNVGGNVTGSVGSVATGGIAAASFAAGAINAAALAADAVDEIWDEAVDGAVTARQSLRLANSANGGLLSGAATTNVLIRDLADTKNRVDATVDSDGNRTAITRDLT